MFMVLLFIVVIAVAVVLIVALPQLRSGSEIFTEDGKQAVARAGQVARTGPIAVVGGTKSLISGTSQKLRPVSDSLHAQLDRLEERDGRTRSGSHVAAGRRAASSASDDDVHRAASPSMVAPRPVPAESGPIPRLIPDPSADPAPEVTRDVVPPRLDVVIDLRESESQPSPQTRPNGAAKVAADRTGEPSAD